MRHFKGAETAFRSISLEPRLPVGATEVFRFREEYVRHRKLTAWTVGNISDPSEIVDVIITHDLASMKVKRVRVRGRVVRLASIDDLIRMKPAAVL